MKFMVEFDVVHRYSGEKLNVDKDEILELLELAILDDQFMENILITENGKTNKTKAAIRNVSCDFPKESDHD